MFARCGSSSPCALEEGPSKPSAPHCGEVYRATMQAHKPHEPGTPCPLDSQQIQSSPRGNSQRPAKKRENTRTKALQFRPLSATRRPLELRACGRFKAAPYPRCSHTGKGIPSDVSSGACFPRFLTHVQALRRRVEAPAQEESALQHCHLLPSVPILSSWLPFSQA